MNTPASLFLYVWEEVSLHVMYYPGLAFAIAPDLDTARHLVQLKVLRPPLSPKDIDWGPVTIHPLTAPVSYFHLGEDL